MFSGNSTWCLLLNFMRCGLVSTTISIGIKSWWFLLVFSLVKSMTYSTFIKSDWCGVIRHCRMEKKWGLVLDLRETGIMSTVKIWIPSNVVSSYFFSTFVFFLVFIFYIFLIIFMSFFFSTMLYSTSGCLIGPCWISMGLLSGFKDLVSAPNPNCWLDFLLCFQHKRILAYQWLDFPIMIALSLFDFNFI